MSRISISREHHLPEARLREQMEALAEKLVAKYGGSYQWRGSDLHYKYSGGLDAVVSLGAKEVNVDIKLGMLLSAFRGTVEREVNTYLDENLA